MMRGIGFAAPAFCLLVSAQRAPETPAVPAPQLPLSRQEQARILADVRQNALHYSNSLPDFICLQVTRRYYNPYGKEDSWIPSDTIAEQLTYFDHHEEYKMLSHNDQATNVDAEKLGGSLSRGEFASLLREIFEPRTQAHFEWDGLSGNGKRWWYVFTFRVPLATSQYTLHSEHGKEARDIRVGYTGSVFIDKETNQVMRVRAQADHIPAGFPVRSATQQLDYDFQKIGDREFLLPLVSEMRLKLPRLATRNVIQFRMYNRYSADTVIQFDEEEINRR